jgi:YVTN family beta-propeller protein
MKISTSILTVVIFINLMQLSGCRKDSTSDNEGPVKPPDTGQIVKPPFAEGIFITNEGQFPSGSGSVSFYNRTTGLVQNDIFNEVNGFPLGSVVQSMEVYDSLAYIVVNNSGKVEVVNAGTFKSTGTIIGLNSPRYFLGIDSTKAYVSDWPNTIAVINLQTLSVLKTVSTGTGPDKMLLNGDEVYVINGGGWGIDSSLTLINTHSDQVIKTIAVGKRPTGIVRDASGGIWVMCSGKGYNGWPQADDSEGHLLKINPHLHTIEKNIVFPGTALHPEKLVINKEGTILYFLYSGGIYQMNIASASYEYYALVNNGNFYNLGYDPFSGFIFASDPVNFQQDGYVYRFNATNGAKMDSVKVSVGPGEFCFR